MICTTCKVEYKGHHASKYCPQCKAAGLKVKTPTESYAKDVGDFKDSQERSAIIDAVEPTPAEKFAAMTHKDYMPPQPPYAIGVPYWQHYGMCDGGEELVPNWILSQGKLVKVGPPASQKALQLMWDAFQIKTCNRVPILGDFDYGVKK